MKKFVFNLAALLQLREWDEQKARQNYMIASRNARQMELAARDSEAEKESIFESWNRRGAERFSRNERIALEASIMDADRKHEEFVTRFESAKKEERAARAKVSDAIRKRKAVENLKQRRFQAYQSELAKTEFSEIEDIYSSRMSERKIL